MRAASCPTDDTLGALIEHALDEGEAARVGTHLDGCDACRAAVAAAVRADAATRIARGTPSLPRVTARARGTGPVAGMRMGRYELRALLGAGGMGQVFRAYDGELDREIALKVLRPELARTAGVLAERLVRESRLMARVEHPAVITVHDVGREGDAVFIAMELVRGETLAAYVRRARPRWREVAAIFERAGRGLAAAHAAGIVHRDFKPENVLVATDGPAITKVVVTDFGIATAALADEDPQDAATPDAPAEPRLTATGLAIGTPAYMAPEQLAGRPVDRRVDVFAFSVSLWEALFGARPFPGKTVQEIRDAMATRPRPPRDRVPARLVRALERGLAIDPVERGELTELLDVLVAVRSRRRRAIAVGVVAGVGLVGAGIAGALALVAPPADDPCARGAAALARAYGPADAAALAGVLDAATLKRLESSVAAWKTTHAATCQRDREPAQPPAVATCLEARRQEIEAFVADARLDGAKAAPLAPLMLDPARCRDPRSGLLVARVPANPAERRAVTALRYRAFAIEDTRDRAELVQAIEQAKALVAETASAWPPVRAELLYLFGTTQVYGGDPKLALSTLREAAALAERAHHDYIAANCWIQLVHVSAFDDGNPARALEYATYADAALDRIGRPPDAEVLFLYNQGAALIEADRAKDAEVVLRRAMQLAEQHAPEYVARMIQGLGYLYEEQGRYAEAADAYRRAIDELGKAADSDASVHVFYERLAINLSLLNRAAEAEAKAREAVALADRTLGADSVDRALTRTTLAQVLQTIGKPEEALAELRVGKRDIARLQGERSQRYGEVLSLEGSLLVDLDRHAEASRALGRACDVIAFNAGEESTAFAECLISHTIALEGLGRPREALRLVERALAILVPIDGEGHPRVASALVQRAALRSMLGRRDEAIADFEQAIAALAQQQLEPGHLAGAKWGLAQTLWPLDKVRARALVAEAIELFGKATDSWAASKADAEAWLRQHGPSARPAAP